VFDWKLRGKIQIGRNAERDSGGGSGGGGQIKIELKEKVQDMQRIYLDQARNSKTAAVNTFVSIRVN
jgi:hypothetical protein